MSSPEITEMLQRGHLSPEAMRGYLAGTLPAEVMRAVKVFLATNPLYAEAMEGVAEFEAADDAHIEATLGLLDKRREKLVAGRSRISIKQFEWIPRAGMLAAAVAMIGITAFVIHQVTKEDAHRNFADLKNDKTKQVVVVKPNTEVIAEAKRIAEEATPPPPAAFKGKATAPAAAVMASPTNTPATKPIVSHSIPPIAVADEAEDDAAGETFPTKQEIAARTSRIAATESSKPTAMPAKTSIPKPAAPTPQSNDYMSAAPVAEELEDTRTYALKEKKQAEKEIATTAIPATAPSAAKSAYDETKGKPVLPLSPVAEYDRAQALLKAGKTNEAKKILKKLAEGSGEIAEKAKALLKTL